MKRRNFNPRLRKTCEAFHRAGKLRLLTLLVTIVLGFVTIVLLTRSSPESPETAIRSARRSIYAGHPELALQELEPFLKRNPADGNVCFLAGEAFSELKDFAAAAEEFGRVPTDHSRRAEACFRAGDIFLLQLFRLTDAEKNLREAVSLKPAHQAAQAHLAALYGLCGLTRLSTAIRFERVRGGQFAEVDLVLLALGDTAAENADAVKSYESKSPDDPLTVLARAHQSWQNNRLSEAQRFYEEGLGHRPELFDAQARLGRVLLERGLDREFLEWHSGLHAAADESAEIWAVRGDRSARQRDLRGAVRCYWEAARLDPVHRQAHFQLGQILATLGETEIAHVFQHRNDVLQRLLLTAKQCNLSPAPETVLRTLEVARECGHVWETWGWAEVLRKRFPDHAEVVRNVRQPAPDTPRVESDSRPADTTNFADYPLPGWIKDPVERDIPAGTKDSSLRKYNSENSHSSIRFIEEAERTQLSFQYVHGDEMPGPGMRMFQFSGGGTGVIDFDLDGWPDVYQTQGGRWPLPENPRPADALFRNRRGRLFEEVAGKASIVETRYSQGLALGDVDGDGWCDVFVANVDGNTMFKNNGDGTFQEITQLSGVMDTAWSTSAVCADFNGDYLPDLFIVNYLEGSDLLERICHQSDGTPRACTPHEFDAAEDQLLLNLGDGRFQDISKEAGILAPGGKGLGVIAADFDGSGRLSLFVGNDTTANFFFQNQSVQKESLPRFEETAVVSGLAFDRDGKTQACMGIAAGDANGDGFLDLFVTNYFNESNTLYQKQTGLIFSDQTTTVLRESGLRQLGFGAQFLDADMDGHADLIVTNGHVDDETARGIALEMPTQFFRNLGNAEFTELATTELGPWFNGRYLGRSVARIDWNRDGRIDVLVGMLDTPTALLTNDSDLAGNHFCVKLVAVNSARDAIGTHVTVTTSRGSTVQQLTAGDGYQSSNERTLHFATGDAEQLKISIKWPSGTMDEFTLDVPDEPLIAIEGRRMLSVLPR